MMKLPKIHVKSMSRSVVKTVQDHSPAILAGIGCVGVIGTGVLSAKATIKAQEILREDKLAQINGPLVKPVEHTRKQQIKLVWLCYIPPVVAGALSIASIVGSHRISARRLAAMTAAFAVSQNSLEDYKSKVEEMFGANKEQKVRDSIAQDKVNDVDDIEHGLVRTGKGDQLFMDAYSGRVFLSTMEEVKAAQNHVNHEVIKHGYSSLSDLYDWLGLDHTKLSNDVGWNRDKLMEMTFSTTMTNGGKSCIMVDFTVAPVRDYFRVNPR